MEQWSAGIRSGIAFFSQVKNGRNGHILRCNNWLLMTDNHTTRWTYDLLAAEAGTANPGRSSTRIANVEKENSHGIPDHDRVFSGVATARPFCHWLASGAKLKIHLRARSGIARRPFRLSTGSGRYGFIAVVSKQTAAADNAIVEKR